MSSGDSYPIPDFVVVGGQVGDEVVLIASKSLTSAELREELRYPDMSFHEYRLYPPTYDMYIMAKVKDYVMVRGKDYSEAWRTLFKHWAPAGEQRNSLLPGEPKKLE